MTESIYFQRLVDRDLWVDGSSSLHIDAICNRILEGKFKFFENDVISESAKAEVKKFVSLVGEKLPSTVGVKSKTSIRDMDTSFNIPHQYLTVDINRRILKGFKSRHAKGSLSAEEELNRLHRIADELDQYDNMGLNDVLRCACYIIDIMNANDMVWGPGRGSACCSYILYLLEVHDIDSYAFDLSIDEFLRY